MLICNNCQQSFEGKYCPNCGQKASVARLSLHEIFHELIHAFTHAEKGIVRLIKELVMTPSKVYQGYFRGQRKNYFSPVMFFLLSIGLLIFLGNEVADLEDQITHRNDEFGRYLHQYQKIRYLICIPLISLFTWAFFYKRFNLAECVAFWFFCLGLACIIGSISCLPQALFIHHRDTVRYYADWLSWIMVMTHIFIVFFDRKVWSAVKCFLLGCSYYLILVYIYTFIAWDAGIPVTFNIYDIIRSIF